WYELQRRRVASRSRRIYLQPRFKVSEIWNSREQFEAFGKRLMPILAGAGIQFANPPDIFEVHNIVKG
ncbi:MAG: hypothetical protein ACXW2F_08765, partial [Thermoanaerobaculia bacterium]